MIINDILNAKDSLIKLNNAKFSEFKIVASVYKLVKKVESIYDIVTKEQNKIIDIYVQKQENGQLVIKDNQYQFENEEKKNGFIVEMNKLRFTEVDDISKITIPTDSIQHIVDFSSEDMVRLEPLIEWA